MELRRQFNDPAFRADITRRINQRVELSANPASEAWSQPPGTTSHVYDWMEYIPGVDWTRHLATVHLFRNRMERLAGQPDPVVLTVGDEILVDP